MRGALAFSRSTRSLPWLVLVARAWAFVWWEEQELQQVHFARDQGVTKRRRGCWKRCAPRATSPSLESISTQGESGLRSSWRWRTALAPQNYRGSALFDGKLLRQAAERGFAPATAELGKHMSALENDDRAKEGREWVRKGAAKHDPNGLFYAGMLDELSGPCGGRMTELYAEAAREGHAYAMIALRRISTLEMVVLKARSIALSANPNASPNGVYSAIRRLNNNCSDANDAKLMFLVGRELEGCDQLWDEDRRVSEDLACCIDVYLTVSHRARFAALQTISALKQHRFPRVVAVLIARRVFETREDAFACHYALVARAASEEVVTIM